MNPLRYFILIALVSTINARASQCTELSSQVEYLSAHISQGEALREELNEKIDLYVNKDFKSQGEKVSDETNRNAAKRMMSSRKRLLKALEKSKVELARAKAEYCKACIPEKETPELKQAFCRKCAEHSLCK